MTVTDYFFKIELKQGKKEDFEGEFGQTVFVFLRMSKLYSSVWISFSSLLMISSQK